MAPLYGPAMFAEVLATLVRLSGAANRMVALVGHLLAQLSVSSTHCKAAWEQATVEGGHRVVHAAEDTAIGEYAESLITPFGAIELVVALKAPKSGFRALSGFFTCHGLQYTLKTIRRFPRPICARDAFNAGGGLVVPPSNYHPRSPLVARLPRAPYPSPHCHGTHGPCCLSCSLASGQQPTALHRRGGVARAQVNG